MSSTAVGKKKRKKRDNSSNNLKKMLTRVKARTKRPKKKTVMLLFRNDLDSLKNVNSDGYVVIRRVEENRIKLYVAKMESIQQERLKIIEKKKNLNKQPIGRIVMTPGCYNYSVKLWVK